MFDEAPVLPLPAVPAGPISETLPITPAVSGRLPITHRPDAARTTGAASAFPTLSLVHRCPLLHGGDCALIGIDPAGRVAIEEFYDDWLAQYAFSTAGELLAICDEDYGANLEADPLPDVDLFVAPPSVDGASLLDYTGGRWRGLREEERVSELALPLTVTEKLALAGLKLPGPILGLAESYVLAQAVIRPGLSVVVRRVRVAYAVARQIIDDGSEIDYDSVPIYIAQWFAHASDSVALNEAVIDIGPRPMDAQFDGQQLYIADAGSPGAAGELRIYAVT